MLRCYTAEEALSVEYQITLVTVQAIQNIMDIPHAIRSRISEDSEQFR